MPKPLQTLNYEPQSKLKREPATLAIDIVIGIAQVLISFLIGLLTIAITYPISQWSSPRIVDLADKPLGLIPVGLHRIFRGKKPPSNIPTVEEAIAQAYKQQALAGTPRLNNEQHSKR